MGPVKAEGEANPVMYHVVTHICNWRDHLWA